MFQLIVISACAFAVVSSLAGRQGYGSDIHGSSSSFKAGIGSGLRYIAEGSIDLANNAILNQQLAARQAASAARNSLVGVAAGASARAQAALNAKHILLQRLEQELQQAQQDVASETQQLEQAERSANSVQALLQLAQSQASSVNAAANAAQGTITHATEAYNAANTKLGTQAAMLGAAKRRFSRIAQELATARQEYQATEAAAQQASGAALLAQSNAAQENEKSYGKSLSAASLSFGRYHH